MTGDDTQQSKPTDMMQERSAQSASGSTAAPVIHRPYIGSSDAAMVADLSPWGSPLTVWNRLSGVTGENEQPPLRFYLGKRLEPIILDLYEQRTGLRPDRVLDDDAPPLVSAEHPFIGAHPDFDQLEIKTARSAREWGDDGETVTRSVMAVPLHYFLQVQHQMFVTGWRVMDIAVLIGHDEFRRFTVPRDNIVIERLVAAEVELWDFVQRGEPPPKSDAAARAAYLRARFPTDTAPLRPATPHDDALVRDWRDRVAARKDAELAEVLAADRLKNAIGAASGLIGLVTYKAQTRRDIDRDALKSALHEIGRDDIMSAVEKRSTFRALRNVSRKENDVE